jgi:hypothetical protein
MAADSVAAPSSALTTASSKSAGKLPGKKWQLLEYEEIDHVTHTFRVRYEPNPDYVDTVTCT